jgi:hypothetical protein
MNSKSYLLNNIEVQVMFNNYKDKKLTEYEDFLAIVEDIGFMPFSNNCINFISLDGAWGLTTTEQWHTDLPSDPWPWRVQIEVEHRAAYGKLFDKKPGFISLEWYPYFLSARRRGESFKEIYAQGLISNSAKQIYELFNTHKILATHEIKGLCGFNKETNSKYESAMNELQMGMFLTTNGMLRKIGANGDPYGWPATAYSTVETWAGEELIERAWSINPKDAMDEILLRIDEITPGADPKKVKRFAGF